MPLAARGDGIQSSLVIHTRVEGLIRPQIVTGSHG